MGAFLVLSTLLSVAQELPGRVYGSFRSSPVSGPGERSSDTLRSARAEVKLGPDRLAYMVKLALFPEKTAEHPLVRVRFSIQGPLSRPDALTTASVVHNQSGYTAKYYNSKGFPRTTAGYRLENEEGTLVVSEWSCDGERFLCRLDHKGLQDRGKHSTRYELHVQVDAPVD